MLYFIPTTSMKFFSLLISFAFSALSFVNCETVEFTSVSVQNDELYVSFKVHNTDTFFVSQVLTNVYTTKNVLVTSQMLYVSNTTEIQTQVFKSFSVQQYSNQNLEIKLVGQGSQQGKSDLVSTESKNVEIHVSNPSNNGVTVDVVNNNSNNNNNGNYPNKNSGDKLLFSSTFVYIISLFL